MKKLILLILALVFLNSSCVYAQEKKELSKEEILSVALNKAKGIPYNVDNMQPVFDENNERWKKTYEMYCTYHKDLPDEEPQLAGKDYQAVYFMPKDAKEGTFYAGLWVFIDKKTGEMIYFEEEPN